MTRIFMSESEFAAMMGGKSQPKATPKSTNGGMSRGRRKAHTGFNIMPPVGKPLWSGKRIPYKGQPRDVSGRLGKKVSPAPPRALSRARIVRTGVKQVATFPLRGFQARPKSVILPPMRPMGIQEKDAWLRGRMVEVQRKAIARNKAKASLDKRRKASNRRVLKKAFSKIW